MECSLHRPSCDHNLCLHFHMKSERTVPISGVRSFLRWCESVRTNGRARRGGPEARRAQKRARWGPRELLKRSSPCCRSLQAELPCASIGRLVADNATIFDVFDLRGSLVQALPYAWVFTVTADQAVRKPDPRALRLQVAHVSLLRACVLNLQVIHASSG